MTSLYDRMEAKLDGHPTAQNILAAAWVAWTAVFLPLMLVIQVVDEMVQETKARDRQEKIRSQR